ncbi:hypothetical protein F8O02_01180 [Pseudoclavibacter caeni]|uniref:Uncharacterized protein n=1 Tax=Pseudoclavibacter caeni TaxID=908846 RepID=A0A7C8FRI1_9MICO|nr:hypothetical protein F8O02_01180 [Pseudoclavibacter caeni]
MAHWTRSSGSPTRPCARWRRRGQRRPARPRRRHGSASSPTCCPRRAPRSHRPAPCWTAPGAATWRVRRRRSSPTG